MLAKITTTPKAKVNGCLQQKVNSVQQARTGLRCISLQLKNFFRFETYCEGHATANVQVLNSYAARYRLFMENRFITALSFAKSSRIPSLIWTMMKWTHSSPCTQQTSLNCNINFTVTKMMMISMAAHFVEYCFNSFVRKHHHASSKCFRGIFNRVFIWLIITINERRMIIAR